MTLAELKDRAGKAWWRSLEARVLGEPFFPWEVPLPRVNSRGDDYEDIARQCAQLVAGSKTGTGHGYTVVSETRNLRLWGKNTVPVRLIFSTAEDLDAFLDRREQAAKFAQLYADTTDRFPALREWTAQHSKQVLENRKVWADLLLVCEYFVATPRPGVYLREIPLPLHTKFIEEHRGILRLLLDQLLPAGELGGGGFETRYGLRVPATLVRVRFLDAVVRERLGFPFEQVGIDRVDFARLPLAGVNLLVTENEVPFLTLPSLPNAIGVWGSGFAVTALGNLPVLQEARVWYWGDLDAQGFEILALLRERVPAIRTLLMDRGTWERFQHHAVPGQAARFLPGPHLTVEEAALHDELKSRNLRFEQERIPHAWASAEIRRALA